VGAALAASDDLIGALLAGKSLTERDNSEGEHDQRTMRRWVALLAQADDESRRIVLLEAEARLRRLALTCETSASPQSSGHSSTVERAIRLIAKRFMEPLSVPTLASELGLHPNYLSALFRRETGQTLSRYLTEYRLAHACALLVGTGGKIIDIAYAAGFGSVSQFHTMFHRYRGCSPRHYRLSHRPPPVASAR
jgi:AraC-like DNA-binding protein